MRKRTKYLILIVTIPTIIWAILGYIIFLRLGYVIPIQPLERIEPLNIPFWNLATSASEQNREKKINACQPGSGCPKQYAKINTEFTKSYRYKRAAE